ncbi:hypothetical protein FGL97_09025 [Pseudomonas putida]|uniref:hypothetical protein n=1 Tax=Pseudomonas putida TaxID=303 RepID=UPI00159E0722|nr:hypothetical protein [Pseudomonas putida]NVN63365.1 hypothetical protein [Pseudomonas putida]NVN68358.1 hypothetical protein [Pseudomonas putida]
MNTETQATMQNFDAGLLAQLRQDADAHCLDLSRCKMAPLSDGRYALTFDAPVCDISRFCPGAPTQLTARSAGQAEGLMLLWCKRIQIGERQSVRTGAVGLDNMQINRTPITAAELDRYRARQREAELQAKIARELVQAVEERQAEADKEAAADLAARYPGSVGTPRKSKPAPAVPELPTVHVKRGALK